MRLRHSIVDTAELKVHSSIVVPLWSPLRLTNFPDHSPRTRTSRSPPQRDLLMARQNKVDGLLPNAGIPFRWLGHTGQEQEELHETQTRLAIVWGRVSGLFA